MKDKIQKLKVYLKKKNKFILQNPNSFEQKFALSITKLNTILVAIALFLVFGLLFFFIISYTGIKKYIPGFPKNASELYEMDRKNQKRIYDLETKTRNSDLWVSNLQSILNNEDTITIKDINNTLEKDSSFDYKSIVFERSVLDSTLREKENDYQTTNKNSIVRSILVSVLMYKQPCDGNIIKAKRKGLDEATFAAKRKTKIENAMEGVVVNSSKESLILQHQNNIITVYDNLSNVKAKVGDKISQGKTIGIAPDSIIRFQIWYNGETVPVEAYQDL